MTIFPFAAIGFDLDGTLVDSNLDLCPAINHTLALEGRPAITPAQSRGMVGAGVRKLLERALDHTGGPVPPARFEELAAELLDHYSTHIADRTRPFDGCLQALDTLADHGCTLAVCTNKVEVLARELLERLGIAGRFACIMGGDTMGPGRGKPAPDMIVEAIRQCGGGPFAMVGDSSYDVRAARAAGVPVVAFSFGYCDMPVAEMAADAVVDRFGDLVPALQRLG